MRQKSVDDSYTVPALVELAVDVVVRHAVNHEHLCHVVRKQLARVANVYCCFCLLKKSYDLEEEKNIIIGMLFLY